MAQSPSLRQATQRCELGSNTVPLAHSFGRRARQAAVLASHTGAAALVQSALVRQATHEPRCGSAAPAQYGVLPEQSAALQARQAS